MPTFTDKDQYHSVDTIKQEPRRLQSFFNKVLTAFILVVIVLSGYFMYLVVSTSGQVFQNSDPTCNSFFCSFQNGLSNVPKLFSSEAPIKGQDKGRTNILLLGMDTTGSSGLTDTIIIASIYHKEKKITTINIPRDFLVSYDGERFKINELYRTAEQSLKGSGATELSKFLEKEYGIEIPYWATANFDGTQKIIDIVGGIDVDVENSFTDCEFPTKGYTGYIPCQKFQKGVQKMNGERALIFARSRHGDGVEGSDFARSRRQSIVIQSILQKIKSQNLLDNLSKLSEFAGVLGENVKTNFNPAEIKSLFSLTRQINLSTDFLKINWAVGNGILCDDESGDQGYYIHYCGDLETGESGQVAGTKSLPSPSRLKAKSTIQNLLAQGEFNEIADLPVQIFGNGAKSGQKTYNLLQESGFTNVKLNNAYTKIPVTATPEKITVYILDNNLKNNIDKALQTNIKYTIVDATLETLPLNVILPKPTATTSSATLKIDPKTIIWIE